MSPPPRLVAAYGATAGAAAAVGAGEAAVPAGVVAGAGDVVAGVVTEGAGAPFDAPPVATAPGESTVVVVDGAVASGLALD
jgi:hypothetical protein